jgi:hypothetical protein
MSHLLRFSALTLAGMVAACVSDPCCVTCETVSETEVGWTEETEVGVPAEVFSDVEGRCEAPFFWDGAALSDVLEITPENGAGLVTVTVSLNHGTVKLVARRPQGTGGDTTCPTLLEVTGQVSMTRPEGIVLEDRDTKLVVSREPDVSGDSRATRVSGTVDASALADWVDVGADDGITVSASFDMEPVQTGCVGTIGLRADWEESGQSRFVSLVDFAAWPVGDLADGGASDAGE